MTWRVIDNHKANRLGRRLPTPKTMEEADLLLILANGAHSHPVESVLDLDSEGFVIGIEILGIVSESQLVRGPRPEERSRVGAVSVSIDYEADAMYVRLMEGTSTHQVVRSAVVTVAEDGSLASVEVLSGT